MDTVPTLSASEVLRMIRAGSIGYTIAKRNRKSIDLNVLIPGWPATKLRVPAHLAEGL